MELSRIAARQKRAKDWQAFLEGEVSDKTLKQSIDSHLREYRKTLTRCAEKEAITEQDEANLRDLERKLEQLNEEARLKAGYA